MLDLSYNIDTEDWDFINGDFVTTSTPSIQNAGIILLFRAFSSANPLLGIGVYQIRGGSTSQANYEMNRWKGQVVSDGGQASFTSFQNAQGVTEFSYLALYTS